MNTNSLINSILPISILLLPNCLLAKNPNKEIKDTKQNIIVIISDDLGFGHVSAYGSKSISTPDIDYLSNKGVCLTRLCHFSNIVFQPYVFIEEYKC